MLKKTVGLNMRKEKFTYFQVATHKILTNYNKETW